MAQRQQVVCFVDSVEVSPESELNLAIHGESRTIEKIKSGKIDPFQSVWSLKYSGCSAILSGRMDYVCV